MFQYVLFTALGKSAGLVAGAACICLLYGPLALATEETFVRCAQKYESDNAGRLKCYDQSAKKDSPLKFNAERSYLTQLWNLDNLTNLDASKLEQIRTYRQTYFLVKYTNLPNRQPSSPAIGNNSVSPTSIDALETKFQFSFKSDIGSQRNLDILGITTMRFWAAYTQQSNWQTFNILNSSPFRETTYEPELIANFGTGNTSGLKFINIGGVHQSNGRTMPESRSWQGIYVLGGFEWSNTTSVLLRAWQRIPESPAKDDNPDLVDYLGRGDLFVRWEPVSKTQSIAMLLRNNFSLSSNRGFMQIDWATPVQIGNMGRLHMQITSGYGESLTDYNHQQNTIGLGISFREW